MSFEGLPLIGLTAPALLGLAVLLLLTGRIIPRSTLVDKQRECDQWREAYLSEREARATSDFQTGELLEVAKTSHAVMVAVFETVQKGQTGGSSALPKE